MARNYRVSNGIVTHHFPLRPDLMIVLELPVDLTEADAERIAGFVRGLSWPRPPLGKGETDG